MNEAAALRDFFAREAPPEVLAAYLFGSRAAGAPHAQAMRTSAWYLEPGCCLDPAAPFNLRIDLTGRLIHALRNNDVDVVLVNDAPPLLAAAIVTAGVPVYSRDARRLTAVARDLQLRAGDLEPFLRRMEQRLLERLATS
jgi:uncharacterized protein